MNLRILSVLFALLFLAKIVGAEEVPPERKKIKVLGIVQYAHGNVVVRDTSFKEDARYQLPIYAGNTVKIRIDSYVKIRTRNECILISYERSQISSKEDDDHFTIDTNRARVICRDGASETITLNNQTLTLESDSELYFARGKLVIFSNNGKETQQFKPNEVYEKDGDNWKQISMSPIDQWNWERENKMPAESLHKDITQPERSFSYRFMIAPTVGFGESTNTENSEIVVRGGDMSGGKVIANFQWHDRSILARVFGGQINTRGQKDNQNKNGCMGCPPVEGNYVEFNFADFALGMRFDGHNSLSSPYALVGITRISSRVERNKKVGQFQYDNLSATTVYTGLSVAAGYDKMFFAKSIIALYTAVEFYFTHSLGAGYYEQRWSQPPSRAENAPVLGWGVHVSFGPMLQF